MTTSAGAEALRLYLSADPSRSQSGLATALGVSQPSVNDWVHDTARPKPHLREALEILTGIPARSWDTADERALVESVRTRAEDAARDSTVDRSADFDQTAGVP